MSLANWLKDPLSSNELAIKDHDVTLKAHNYDKDISYHRPITGETVHHFLGGTFLFYSNEVINFINYSNLYVRKGMMNETIQVTFKDFMIYWTSAETQHHMFFSNFSIFDSDDWTFGAMKIYLNDKLPVDPTNMISYRRKLDDWLRMQLAQPHSVTHHCRDCRVNLLSPDFDLDPIQKMDLTMHLGRS